MINVRGCGTALVTPFDSQGQVDRPVYGELIRWQLDSGIHFLVPTGTTGESVTLTEDEYRQVVRTCVESVSGAVPVVAGAGTNNTEHTIHLAQIAEKEGADAILSVTPYYNKPTQEGLFLHFQKIATAVTIPVVLYNVPGRTGNNMTAQTTLRLAELENIIGVKEASGNLSQIMEIIAHRPAGFVVLSGDDNMALSIIALGGDGVISVAGNLIPSEMSRMSELARCGKLDEAREIHYRFLNLMNLNFLESNPIPVKYALARMGRLQERYRLPLCPMSPENKRKMDQELERLELVNSR